MKNNITVITVVYNEEERIETLLKSMQWSDDIIVVEKSSTDKTKEIALRYTQNVITVPYSDTGDETKYGVKVAKNEWVMTVTASDIMHPKLAGKLLELVNNEKINTHYDIIRFPFQMGALGIIDKHSPWYFPLKPWLCKKSVLVTKNEVHREVSFSSNRIYKMKKSNTEAMFHLTHQDLDSFFERHLRYTKAETKKYDSKVKGLLTALKEMFLAIIWLIFYKRVWLLGWNGIALAFAFLSYYMMKYLFIWEKFEGKGAGKYKKLQDSILKEWGNKSN